ncbi:glycerate kinase type-2 family protein [Desulfosediminicola sp.]|uniref:glycerate kinase type-2 family protein n=1 Tax=Desulfosediminicola sp. TaxID=2886825 RepID=UPI003AF27DB2
MVDTKLRRTQKEQLDQIFKAALDRVSPYKMMRDHVTMDGSLLRYNLDGKEAVLDLDQFSEVLVLGAGKATAPMALALEEILGPRISDGLVVVKYGHTEQLSRVRMIEAAHPVPDEQGVKAAAELLRLAERAKESSLVITLISGGGSALLPLPGFYQGEDAIQLTLSDKQQTTQTLLSCGADITEINCVRKHLSAIKGGRLLAAIAPARSINFILSDVVGDDLSSIASGLTAADVTTFSDALAIIEKYDLHKRIPVNVCRYLELGAAGKVEESLKPEAPALDLTSNVLMGTNRTALEAAAIEAEKLGYRVVRLTSRITGDTGEVAKMLTAIVADTNQYAMLGEPPLCIISGGEPVVVLTGKGKGGRNQQLALHVLKLMQQEPALYEGVSFLSAATDGNDGPTDAAGGYASLGLVQKCQELQLDIAAYLRDNDAYNFYSAINGLYITGPTNTNVCDLQIFLVN